MAPHNKHQTLGQKSDSYKKNECTSIASGVGVCVCLCVCVCVWCVGTGEGMTPIPTAAAANLTMKGYADTRLDECKKLTSVFTFQVLPDRRPSSLLGLVTDINVY